MTFNYLREKCLETWKLTDHQPEFWPGDRLVDKATGEFFGTVVWVDPDAYSVRNAEGTLVEWNWKDIEGYDQDPAPLRVEAEK